jgi:cytochrome c oxidase subunit I
MPYYESDGNAGPNRKPPGWPASVRDFAGRHIFSKDHKQIGLLYLWLALLCVFLGLAMSMLLRVYAAWPNAGGVLLRGLAGGFGDTPERYGALMLLHGSLMVFFVLTAAPQAGLGNYLLPLQIGAREMAFPWVNVAAVWMTAASAAAMTGAFFLSPAAGVKLWVASVAVFALASLLGSINFCVTTIDLRAKGMTLPRLPVTVWAWFINAILSLLIFSIVLAACVLLLADGFVGTHFFREAYGESPAAGWQRLFWFFAQAEVYVAMLPCFGIVTHLLAMLARRPVWRERAVVLALCAAGLTGFCIWGQHMFATGMDPAMPMMFGVLAASLGLPAGVLVLSWFGILWNGRMRLDTSSLFVLGFISLFLSGGFSGIILARRDIYSLGGGNEFVSGHYHMVMGVTATFAILAALYFWFPRLFERRLHEGLGKLHFWLTFVGVYCVFMPMHWVGLMARGGAGVGLASVDGRAAGGWTSFISMVALATVAAQGIFVVNLVGSLWRGERVYVCNPWRATTLEWMPVAPDTEQHHGRNADRSDAGAVVVHRGAYEFDESGNIDDYIPQYFPPERVASHATKVR